MINAVIDISHHNKVSSFTRIQESGIFGLIHKATQGNSFTDPNFNDDINKARDAGLQVGAYHFGTGGDAIAQAEFFVSVAGVQPLLVLDFESNPQGQDMSFDEAEQFVQHINQLTGRYPGLYSGNTIKHVLSKHGITSPTQTILSNCWLWIAQYSFAPHIPKVWNEWALWQYTDGVACPKPHVVDGVGNCDRDQFNGSLIDLQAFWKENSGQ